MKELSLMVLALFAIGANNAGAQDVRYDCFRSNDCVPLATTWRAYVRRKLHPERRPNRTARACAG
jgi:hypothetical protein